MVRKIFGNDHEFVASSVGNLSLLLWERGKLAEAEALCREALTLMRKHYGDEHPAVATTLNNRGLIKAKLLRRRRLTAKFPERPTVQFKTRKPVLF